MIICPACKEEIEDDSHYCDQCGQALLFCNQCGRVGLGRRCTHCGGLMVSPDDRQANQQNESPSVAAFASNLSTGISISRTGQSRGGMPVLTLANDSLNIRIVAMNGAIIGRRKGPYTQFFEQQAYVSGVSIFEGLIEVEIIEATTFKVSFKLFTLTLGCLSLTSLIYVSFKIEVACFAFPESFFCS